MPTDPSRSGFPPIGDNTDVPDQSSLYPYAAQALLAYHNENFPALAAAATPDGSLPSGDDTSTGDSGFRAPDPSTVPKIHLESSPPLAPSVLNALAASFATRNQPDPVGPPSPLPIPRAYDPNRQPEQATASGMIRQPAVSDRGVGFIRAWEAPLHNDPTKPYDDGFGNMTNGYGHLLTGGSGPAITQTMADGQLRDDAQHSAKAVLAVVKTPLNQQQLDALTSLHMNAPSAFRPQSTLVQRLNAQDYAGAADAFGLYSKAWNNKTKEWASPHGLALRRKAERDTFLNGSYDSKH